MRLSAGTRARTAARELYVLGDLPKAQYRRQALEEVLQRSAPPTDPDLERAQALLQNFARFWEAKRSGAERRKLLTALFQNVWQKDGTIVGVKTSPFVRYFTTVSAMRSNQLS